MGQTSKMVKLYVFTLVGKNNIKGKRNTNTCCKVSNISGRMSKKLKILVTFKDITVAEGKDGETFHQITLIPFEQETMYRY